ncbi:hypothetical protein QN219_31380 [Sinorhizobium sp. 7-81]|nr:hypothetical protein [Sinorhizobium sp. 8-89]
MAIRGMARKLARNRTRSLIVGIEGEEIQSFAKRGGFDEHRPKTISVRKVRGLVVQLLNPAPSEDVVEADPAFIRHTALRNRYFHQPNLRSLFHCEKS